MFSEFLSAVPLLKKIGSNKILLATDDQNVVKETNNFPEWNFFTIPRERTEG